MKIASSQLNHQYGANLHYPYSIGCILAYAAQHVEQLDVLPCGVQRHCMDDHIARAASADVLLASNYVWNFEATSILAKEAKIRHPGLFIIYGGPQIPDDATGFFDNHPYVDALVHGEGEIAVTALLRGERSGPGITTRATTSTPSRLTSLDGLPSPYTSGMIDRLTSGTSNISWVATWETNRGCPYQCTFCDWGSATYTKLRQYPMGRLIEEIDWFSKRGIEYIDCADSNFGILARDLELARRIKESAIEHGAPTTFRQSWSKNSSEKVIAVAQELKAAGLLTAVGLAVQSLDATTLNIVKRKNLPFERFSDLTEQFKEAQLPTYTEVIRGLPGETLDSFKRGLCDLASNSLISTIYIYNCSVLPNAPMAVPSYMKAHGIRTVRSPIYLAHSSIQHRDIDEYEEVVVATSAMPEADMLNAYLFSWLIALGESLWMFKALRQHVNQCGISTLAFYEALTSYLLVDTQLFGCEYRVAQAYAVDGYAGRGWNHHDTRLGDIFWPMEEASWLRLVSAPGFRRHLSAMYYMLTQMLGIEFSDECALAQADLLAMPTGDLPTWARDTMWYGRRRGLFLKERNTL